MDQLRNLISNDISKLNNPFTAIIGSNPSKGARSPNLWNAAFKEFQLSISMYPFDVERENINNLFDYLENNKFYKGGAVAAPYKVLIAKALKGNITNEAKSIGAINCIFRDEKGKLKGTNTDGEAALKCIEEKVVSLDSKNILIIGSGGVAKAVCGYLSTKLGDNSSLIIASRSMDFTDSQIEKFRINKLLNFNNFTKYLEKIDVLVNCSSIGWNDQINSSPLSLNELSLLPKNAFVYDVIYQPLETKLLTMSNSLNILNTNGLKMNLEQALIAFKYVMPEIINNDKDYFRVKKAMQNV